MKELERFKKATIQRELRMKELGDENDLLKKRMEEVRKKVQGRFRLFR